MMEGGPDNDAHHQNGTMATPGGTFQFLHAGR
jgi:hypothetical protein